MDHKNENMGSLGKQSPNNASKELSFNSDMELIKGDSRQDGIYRKLLHTISSSFSKKFERKMTRLLLFIRNFGAHLITFNENGNVLVRN